MIEKIRDVMNNEWKEIQFHVFPVFLSMEEREKEVQERVTRRVWDLVISYEIIYDLEGQIGFSSVMKEHMKVWGITEDILFQQAKENQKRHGILLQSVTEYLFGEAFPRGEDPLGLYVMTNQEFFHGASCMLMQEELQKFADTIGKNLFLIPSSIHEILLLPEEKLDPKSINEIINAVNGEEVSPAERLSDHVYYFNREKGKIQIVTDRSRDI